jgi:hypothetical protein
MIENEYIKQFNSVIHNNKYNNTNKLILIKDNKMKIDNKINIWTGKLSKQLNNIFNH